MRTWTPWCRALAAGANAGDTEDLDFMYGRSFNDLVSHSWQVFCSETAKG